MLLLRLSKTTYSSHLSIKKGDTFEWIEVSLSKPIYEQLEKNYPEKNVNSNCSLMAKRLSF